MIPLISLAIIFFLVGLLLVAIVWFWMAWALVHPPRMTDGKAVYILKRLSPMDLGLDYQNLRFSVTDHHTGRPLNLAAWWIPANPASRQNRCAILIHGYADAKVGAIAWAPMFHELGFHILAVDLRAHGESQGRTTTAGYFERYDLNQVIDQIRQRYPQQTSELILFGISMGAAIVAATAVMRQDLSAVILECPYADFSHAAEAHGRLMGMPLPALQRNSIQLAQVLTGAKFSQIRPTDLIPKIPCPLMVIQSQDDPLVSPSAIADLKSAADSRPPAAGFTDYWLIPNAGHVLGMAGDPQAYFHRVKSFLSRAMGDETSM